MSTQRIPVTFVQPAMALRMSEAAQVLGICTRQLYRLRQMGKIRATSYGVIPVEEIQRHLRAEVQP